MCLLQVLTSRAETLSPCGSVKNCSSPHDPLGAGSKIESFPSPMLKWMTLLWAWVIWVTGGWWLPAWGPHLHHFTPLGPTSESVFWSSGGLWYCQHGDRCLPQRLKTAFQSIYRWRHRCFIYIHTLSVYRITWKPSVQRGTLAKVYNTITKVFEFIRGKIPL